jgi:flagellin-like protein
MSPNGHLPGTKPVAQNNLYTVILAIAVAVVLATLAFVAVKCYLQYGTFYQIP